MPKFTVKVRSRYGTRSLEITIPVKIVKEMSINEGDIFSVEASKNDANQIVLAYTRIFESKL